MTNSSHLDFVHLIWPISATSCFGKTDNFLRLINNTDPRNCQSFRSKILLKSPHPNIQSPGYALVSNGKSIHETSSLRGPFLLFFIVSSLQATWYSPENMTSLSPPENTVGDPDIAIDYRGNAKSVWLYQAGSNAYVLASTKPYEGT